MFAVSAISEYEVYFGSNAEQDIFWNDFFKILNVLPFTSDVNKLAIKTVRQLKRKGLNIDIPDLFIGSTALYNEMKLATLNKKHFEHIDKLIIITP